MMPRSSRLL
uniref:Uncharacterized protein n=1 Tax=Anguilla anguilla TaxID=7936 RepID=A0A0E9TBY5_ANGAN